jgi:hypothetical protein
MEDETKYRVEAPDEQEEKKGFLRPLPEPDQLPRTYNRKKGAITKLLGITMYERTRDIIVLFLIPCLVAIIDTNIYALVIIDQLPNSVLYLFAVPAIAAVPIGLTAGKTSFALFGGIVVAFFFAVFLTVFFASPVFFVPDLPLGDFVVPGLVLAAVYSLLVVFGSLLGSLAGALIREFF